MQALASKKDAIAELCRKYAVTRLSLFGSALRADWNPQSSDFDFLAEFGSPPEGINRFHQFFGLQVDLEELLGRKVDLVDWKAADKPHFRKAVEAEAQEFYPA